MARRFKHRSVLYIIGLNIAFEENEVRIDGASVGNSSTMEWIMEWSNELNQLSYWVSWKVTWKYWAFSDSRGIKVCDSQTSAQIKNSSRIRKRINNPKKLVECSTERERKDLYPYLQPLKEIE